MQTKTNKLILEVALQLKELRSLMNYVDIPKHPHVEESVIRKMKEMNQYLESKIYFLNECHRLQSLGKEIPSISKQVTKIIPLTKNLIMNDIAVGFIIALAILGFIIMMCIPAALIYCLIYL